MTTVELLKRDLDSEMKSGTKMVVNWDMYLEMEKQQIIDAAERWKGTDFAEKYYAETYGSKGNDETKEGYICPATKVQCDDECCVSAKDCHIQSSVGVLSDSSQTEISDEEIENYLAEAGHPLSYDNAFIDGAKWYKEQLKQRQ